MIVYTHKTHPRSRSIKIKIESSGEVVVVTPKRVSQRSIDAFIQQQAVWINQHLAKIKLKKNSSETDTTVMLFGKKYQKTMITTGEIPRGVSIKGNQLLISIPNLDMAPSHIQEKQQTYIERFLKNTAEQYIVPRTHQLAKIMNTQFGTITLRQQKSRWGSCSSQGNLNFNWRLIHAPTEVIDYVIIHELAHRHHMNHSSAFWHLVAQYDPEHTKHRGWLKRQGMSVG
jgi:predicted metal-dependent hydrolase